MNSREASGESPSSPTPTFNLGDLFDLTAEAVPDRIALVWGEDRVSFAQLRDRSDRLAAALLRAGIRRGDTVGLMMYNSTAYAAALLASFKIGAISFNINYRYIEEELLYILDDAQAAGLIQGEEFGEVVEAVLPRVPALKARVIVEQPESPASTVEGAMSYRQMLAEPVGEVDLVDGRSGGDMMLIYTGGTTGLPKGVEWTHEALFFSALGGNGAHHPEGPIKRPEQVGERAAAGSGYVMLGAGPLMHGASVYAAFSCFFMGGTLVLKRARSFDPELVWDLVGKEKVNSFSVMGDAMIAPLITTWDKHPGRWDISSLFSIGSGGAALSQHNQDALRERFPKVMQMNGLGSSESGAVGIGDANTKGDGFMVLKPRDDLAIIVDGVRFAEPGETGIFSRTGHIARGYWRDPKKTAEAFVMVGGRRWILTGDRAKLEDGGMMRLYGRDSSSINTGGEKVFAEEVEAAIRSHPVVADALVIGIPDDRWGQAVAAVIALEGDARLDVESLRDFCSAKLSRYKLPRSIFIVPEIRRSPAGKADLRWAKSVAAGALAGPST